VILSIPLETARLRLRSLRREEAAGPYHQWMGDRELLRFLEIRHVQRQDITALSDYIDRNNASPDTLLLGMFLKSSGDHVGNIKLGPVDGIHRRADIGFLIGDRAARGQGLAAEAIAAVRDLAVSVHGVRKVTAGCYRSNVASARALEKAGFVVEAALHDHWLLDGKPEDGLLFASLATGRAS
jgi:RimJ/RimL family protein N-acetyltransferase